MPRIFATNSSRTDEILSWMVTCHMNFNDVNWVFYSSWFWFPPRKILQRLLDRILNIWSLVSGCNGTSLILKTSCSGSTLLIWQCPTLLSRIHKLVRLSTGRVCCSLSTGRVCCSQWRILCRKWASRRAYWWDPLWLRETINQLVCMCKLNVYGTIPHTMWVKYCQKKPHPSSPMAIVSIL